MCRGTIISRLLIASFIAAVFVAGCFRISCDDIWWQLKAGDVILSQGFPDRNIFSHSEPNGTWETEEWLFEVIAEGWRRAFGPGGLVFLRAVVLALVYLFLFLAARRRGAGTTTTLWVLALSVLAGRERWFIRPHIFTYLFIAVCLYLLALPRKRTDFLFYPALMLLWVNIHPAFALGFVILGAATLNDLANGTTGATRCALLPLMRWWVIALLCSAATLANPHGFRIYDYVWNVSQSANVTGHIAEWGRPNWAEMTNYARALAILCIVALPALLFRKRLFPTPLNKGGSRGDSHLGDFALTVFSLVLFFSARRHLELLALLPIPALAALLTRLGGSSALTPLNKGGKKWPVLLTGLRTVLGLLPAVALVAATFTWERPWGFAPDWRLYPREGVRYIREANPEGNIFNSYRYGGFLLYNLFPERRVFIDGRPYVYSQQLFDNYRTVLNADPGWEEVLDKYDINVLFLAFEPGWDAQESGSLPHALHDSQNWSLVFWDDTCMIYVRRIPDNRAVIARDEYMTVIPSGESASWLPADTSTQLRALDEIDRAIRKDADCAKAYRIRGSVLSLMRREAEAEKAFQKAIEIDPSSSVSHNALGVFHAERRRWDEARREFESAMRLGPLDAASRINLARLCIETGDKKEARRLLGEVLRLDQKDADALSMQERVR